MGRPNTNPPMANPRTQSAPPPFPVGGGLPRASGGAPPINGGAVPSAGTPAINNIVRNVQRARIECLHPHPQQGMIYECLSPGDLQALAENLSREGQHQPVDVLPSNNNSGLPGGTIVDGHNRVAAAKLLGWTDIVVRVRWDLQNATPDAIESAYLEANLHRRQLHPLDKAAVAIRLFEIERKKPHGSIAHGSDECDARDRVGKAVGLSGRHLQRLFRVLLTPRPVQRAVRDGHLPIVVGEKVEGLGAEKQKQLAAEIAALTDPAETKGIVARFLGNPSGRHRKASDAIAAFSKAIDKVISDLSGRANKVPTATINKHLPSLRRAQKVIQQWIATVDTVSGH
jgi:ParB/RepB/Spo0J family partition protein